MSSTLEFGLPPLFTLAFEDVGGTGGTGTGYPIASQPEAEFGTSNTSLMTPLRTHQAIDARIATEAEAIAGVSTTELITPATMKAAAKAALWFFDRAGDLAAVTIPTGIDVIYRFGYLQRGDHEITRFRRKAVAPTTAPTNNLAWETDAAGVYFINDMPRIDCRTLGGNGDFKPATGSMTASGNTVTVTGAFVASDVGKWIQVTGAAAKTAYGAVAVTDNPEGVAVGTITGYVSADQVTVSFTSIATSSTMPVYWGTIDTTSAFNTVRAAATLKRKAYFPAGGWGTSDSVTSVNGFNDIHIVGDGRATTFWHVTRAGAPTGVTVRIVGATTATLAYVVVPAKAGTDTLTFNTVATLAVDMWFTLRDEDQKVTDLSSDAGGAAVSYRGEIVRIKEINPPDAPANSLRFYGAVENDYHADPVKQCVLKRVIPIANTVVENVCFDHTNPTVIAGGAHISMTRGLDAKFKNLRFRHSTGVSLGINDSIYTKALDVDCDMLGSADSTEPFNSYGIQLKSSWGTDIDNFMTRRARHAIDMGGGEIENQHWSISNATAMNCWGANFNTHFGARGGRFINCHAFSSGWPHEALGTDGPQFAFQLRTSGTELVNCSAAGAVMAYYIVYTDNCRVIDCSAEGCLVGLGGLNCSGLEVSGLRLRNMKVGGVRITKASTLTTMPGIILRDIRLYGNPTETSDVAVIRAPVPYAYLFGSYNSSNILEPYYDPGWVIEDLRADDATTKFIGLPTVNSLYGFGKPASVLFENFDNQLVESGALSALTSGTLYFVKMPIDKGELITSISTIFAAAPVAQTNLWFGLYDDSRTKLAVTVDGTTTAPTPDVAKTLALSAPYRTTRKGDYYVGICQVAGTVSTLRGRTSHTSVTGLPPIRAGGSSSGQTVPGSAPGSAAAITAGAIIPYVYLM